MHRCQESSHQTLSSGPRTLKQGILRTEDSYTRYFCLQRISHSGLVLYHRDKQIYSTIYFYQTNKTGFYILPKRSYLCLKALQVMLHYRVSQKKYPFNLSLLQKVKVRDFIKHILSTYLRGYRYQIHSIFCKSIPKIKVYYKKSWSGI